MGGATGRDHLLKIGRDHPSVVHLSNARAPEKFPPVFQFSVSRWDPKGLKPQKRVPFFIGWGLGVPLQKPVRGVQSSWKKNTTSGVSQQHKYLQNKSAKISVLQEGFHSSTHKPCKIRRRDLKKLKYIQSHLRKRWC